MENEEAVFKVGEDEKPVTIEMNQDGSEAKEEGGTPSLEVSVDEAPKKEVQQETKQEAEIFLDTFAETLDDCSYA